MAPPVIVDLPPRTPPVRLVAFSDPPRGTLITHVRPADRTSADHASTLLEGLGKRLDLLHRRSLSVQQRRQLLKLWLRAYPIRTVVLCSPQVVNRRNLDWLLDLLTPAERVVFACDHGASRRLRQLLPDAPRETWQSLQNTLSTPPGQPEDPVPYPSYRLDDLPDADFPTFRADCRRNLDGQAFAELDRLYTATFNAAMRVPPNNTQILEHLQHRGGEVATAGQLLVLVRATQAAFFRRGHRLRVHRDRLLGTLATMRTTASRVEHYEAVRAYVFPAHAAVCALHLMNTTVAEMLRLTVGDAKQLAATQRPRHLAKTTLPAVFLRAQILWRQDRGAQDSDRLLQIGPQQASKILSDARRDLDLPTDAGNIRIDRHNDTRRYTRLGLKLEPLA